MTRARDVASNGGLVLISSTTIGSAVSSVTISNVFSATYNNYKVIVSGGTATVATVMGLKLGATATGYYYSNTMFRYNNTASSTGAANQTSWYRLGTSALTRLSANFELQDPFNAKLTTINYLYADPTTTGEGGVGAGFLNDTTSYTDFTLIPASGTYTGGTISVYGYKK